MKPGEFTFRHALDLIPGHPQTLHPCGCNSGQVEHCAGVYEAQGFGQVTGPLDSNPDIVPAEWEVGSIQTTSWNAWVNHAGGYIYMLCPKAAFDSCREDYLPGNEDGYLECVWQCFESNTLEWAPDTLQKLQYKDDSCSYATMQPQTKVGKDNHTWRATPIPDSLQISNGGEGVCMYDSLESFSNDNVESKFVESFGTEEVCDWGKDSHAPYQWQIMDEVVIPNDLEVGEYLLSWRWDAYKADQMWTNCADVKIVAETSSTRVDTTSEHDRKIEEEDCPTKAPSPPVDDTPTVSPSTSQPAIDSGNDDGGGGGSIDCPSGYSGLLPYDACTAYYHCHNGEVMGDVTDCPEGTLFDTFYNYCNWEDQVECEDEGNATDDGETEGCYSNNYKDCNHIDFRLLVLTSIHVRLYGFQMVHKNLVLHFGGAVQVIAHVVNRLFVMVEGVIMVNAYHLRYLHLLLHPRHRKLPHHYRVLNVLILKIQRC